MTKQDLPKIHIIIPVYNVEKYLEKCLDSCLSQTYQNFDILCINDGSTDSSLEILNRYAKMNKCIKVYSQENKGASAARNFGIKLCSNDGYIAFIDSDDSVTEKYLEYLMESYSTKQFDVSFFGSRIDNPKIDDVLNALVLNQISIGPYQKIIKTELVKATPFDENLYVGEDLWFNYQLYSKCEKFNLIDWKVHCDYIITKNPNSLTRQKINQKRIFDTFESWFLVYESLKSLNFYDNAVLKSNIYSRLGNEFLSFYGSYRKKKTNYKFSKFREYIKYINKNHILKFYHPQKTSQKLQKFIYLYLRIFYKPFKSVYNFLLN